ncbi:zinc finger domain-containing protein [Geomicrobium sp. JCM 19038]|uniref:zinc finger domain-containing protein n=1 Tax=Geomicrobium sp. JCM 19038 TaxID=1460635 RepID=UPI001EE66D92|nr:zinc finger domain-containing protein [Geomicrobium sp. JCM 19038]
MSHPEKLFIVSQLELVKGEETNVSVQKAEGDACERCWHVKEDVGEDESFNTLCTRCADVVKTYDPAILEETAK